MKTSKIKHPRMVEGRISARLRDEESDLERAFPPEKTPGMSEDRQRMADGGELDKDKEEADMNGMGAQDAEDRMREDEKAVHDEYDKTKSKGLTDMFAEGGMIADEEEEEEDHASIASAIMARRKYADGGMVDIESNEEEDPDRMTLDDRNEAILKENYGELSSDYSEDGEDRPEVEEDSHDRVAMIRRKMKKSPITR